MLHKDRRRFNQLALYLEHAWCVTFPWPKKPHLYRTVAIGRGGEHRLLDTINHVCHVNSPFQIEWRYVVTQTLPLMCL